MLQLGDLFLPNAVQMLCLASEHPWGWCSSQGPNTLLLSPTRLLFHKVSTALTSTLVITRPLPTLDHITQSQSCVMICSHGSQSAAMSLSTTLLATSSPAHPCFADIQVFLFYTA